MTTTFTPTTAGASFAEATAVVRLDNLHVAWDTDLILHGISLDIPAVFYLHLRFFYYLFSSTLVYLISYKLT